MKKLLIAAIACLLALSASAKTATLQGATTNSCAFSQFTVLANADVAVTCVTTPAAPPASPPPATSCPASTLPAASLGTAGFVNHMAGVSPFVRVFALPASRTGVGVLGLYQNPYTPVAGPVVTEISISRCKGDFTDKGDGCYRASGSMSQVNAEWADHFTSRQPDAAAFKRAGRCLVDKGAWYINLRMTYPPMACPDAAGKPRQCGWDPIWKPLTL